jgi:hypothetical protein
MIVGKTSSSISISELFEKYSEVQILLAVFPEITSIPCKISSPFRTDSNPSFSIYLDDDKHIRFKDFGESETKGSLLDLLCKKWNCSFHQVFDRILEVMQKQEKDTDTIVKPRQVKLMTRKESSELTKIQVAIRPWKDYDIAYWESYGISRQWLRYAEVYPISHKIITKKDKQTSKSSKYIFPADRLAYVYVERKEGNLSLKIYQPYNTNGFKWCSRMDASVISLWTKVPEYGDRIVICSSLKDALCLSCQLHIPAIALQGEGYTMSQTAINELKRRYQKVFICFDTDTPGKADAQKLSKLTGFPFIVPDLGDSKDFSDYYKSLSNKKDFKQLEKLFH